MGYGDFRLEAFFLLWAGSASKEAWGSGGAACSPLFVISFRLHFEVLRYHGASEGLAPF